MRQLTTIKLGGALGEKFGKTHKLAVHSPADAVAALSHLLPGFKAYLIENSSPGYSVRVGKNYVSEKQLADPLGAGAALRIEPVLAGSSSSSKGILTAIVGVVLIAATWGGATGFVATGLAAQGVSAATALAVSNAVAAIGVGLAINGVSSLLFAPPKANAIEAERADSRPSYSFNGAVNTSVEGMCVPVLFGRLRVGSQLISAGLSAVPYGEPPLGGYIGIGGSGGKGGGGSYRAPSEAPNTLRSTQYAKWVDLLSEGPIAGLVNGAQSIYLDDVPLQNADGSMNFQGVTADMRYGDPVQAPLIGLPGVESETAVGVRVAHGTPVVRSISDPNATSARVTLDFPALTEQDTTTGDLRGSSVTYRLEVQPDGGAWTPAVAAEGMVPGGSIDRSDTALYVHAVNAPKVAADLTYHGGNDSGTVEVFWERPSVPGQLHYITTVTVTRGQTVRVETPILTWEDLTLVAVPRTEQIAVYESGDQPGWYRADVPAGVWNFSLSNPSRWGITGDVTIAGKCVSRYQRTHAFFLPAGGPWNLRVTRVSPQPTTATIQNEILWGSFTSIVDGRFSFPHSAVCGVQVSAEQFSSVPTRAYDLRGLIVRVPTNYDPATRAYSGAWDGTFKLAWTDNPAWVFFELLTNDRFGLGEYIADDMVNVWALYAVAQHCDQLVPDGKGGYEPRFACNLYLQDRVEAYTALTSLASIFYGMPMWHGGQMTCTADKPADPVHVFNQANVIDATFHYSGSARNARHSVAFVSWNCPDENYQTRVESVEDAESIARYGWRPIEVRAVGCTSRGQAVRMGRYILNTEKAERDTVTFRAALEGFFVTPGDVIKVMDSPRAGDRLGGRLMAGTTNSTLMLDAPVTLNAAKSYTVTVMLPTGAPETRAVTPGLSGVVSALTVTQAFSAVPASVWVLEESTLQAQLYRVVATREEEAGIVTITALTYNPSKQNAVEQGWKLDAPTPWTRPVQPITNPVRYLRAIETTYKKSDGRFGTQIELSWQAPLDNAQMKGYRVSWTKDGDGAQLLPDTTETTATIPGPLQNGSTYTLRVWPVGADTRLGPAAQVSLTAQGSKLPPPAVEGLTSVITTAGVELRWNPVTVLDVVEYEIRKGADWASAAFVKRVKTTSDVLPHPLVGSHTFLVKAIDADRNESVSAAATSISVNAPVTPVLVPSAIENYALFSWQDCKTSLPIAYYEIDRADPVNAAPVIIGTVSGTFTTHVESSNGVRRYGVTAVDVAGNRSGRGITDISVDRLPNFVLLLDHQSVLDGTTVDGAPDGDALYFPLPDAETWESHFTSRGWSTPQDQINAGYTLFAQPAGTSGSYEEILDYGATVPVSGITVTPTLLPIVGSTTWTAQISAKKLAGDA